MALTSNGSVVNSGGAVSSLSLTFDSALTEGEVYMFEVGCNHTGTSTGVALYVNSDTTDANYERGRIMSDGTQDTGNLPAGGTPGTGGTIFIMKGAIGLLNGKPWMVCQTVDQDSTRRAATFGVINTSETTFTGLTLVSSSVNIGNDSYIKCWPITDLTTVADVTVSGGAVTTLDTGAFTALSEGKVYLFYGGIVVNGTGTNNQFFYMNGDTTKSNYRRGYIISDPGTGDDSSAPNNLARGATGRIGTSFGFCGVLNNTPYLSYASFYEGNFTTQRNAVVSAYHATETNFDQLQITSDNASGLANGTRIIIKEFA